MAGAAQGGLATYTGVGGDEGEDTAAAPIAIP